MTEHPVLAYARRIGAGRMIHDRWAVLPDRHTVAHPFADPDYTGEGERYFWIWQVGPGFSYIRSRGPDPAWRLETLD